jgi:mannose-6-phosphate isomerase
MQPDPFYLLTGKVQHYQWGGFDYIPRLLEIPNPDRKPFAEYWLGAHTNAPADLQGNGSLDRLLADHPELLGPQIRTRYGRLPYLLKVLDVHGMLSIQVHPDKASAIREFARENQEGIPLNAPHRNYRDDNHKPELMLALGDFWLLHGFRNPESMKQSLGRVPELNFLLEEFSGSGYEGLYRRVMTMDQEQVNRVLQPLIQRIIPAYQTGGLDRENPDFWAARGALTYNFEDRVDRGLFSIYMLNLVHLRQGEAVFQDAGILHAYLEGQNIEIMSNSDNVLRGGLTPKHIDVPELMKHVLFNSLEPQIITGEARGQGERVYPTSTADFELSSIRLGKGGNYQLGIVGTDIFLLLQGRVEATDGEKKLSFGPGQAVIGFNGTKLSLQALENTLLFRASVPLH